MKNGFKLALLGALLLSGPASAQIVNGNNGANGSPSAPIGTKAGGSDAAQQAPGEAQATAGAIANDRDAKTMQNTDARRAAHDRNAPPANTTRPDGQ
jgi:hypothetical protein